MEITNLENKDPNGNMQNPRPRLFKSSSQSNLDQLRKVSASLKNKLVTMNGRINTKLFLQKPRISSEDASYVND